LSPIFRQKIPGSAWGTVEEAAGGGGAALGALGSLSAIAASGLTSAVAHTVAWEGLDVPIGSGISLNADTETIEVTEGWYQIAVLADIFSNSNFDAQVSIIGLINDPGWNVYGPGGQAGTPSASILLNTPPISFNSGDQLSFKVQTFAEITFGEDTWSLGPSALRLWRLNV
jgi:hypothetical protein